MLKSGTGGGKRAGAGAGDEEELEDMSVEVEGERGVLAAEALHSPLVSQRI